MFFVSIQRHDWHKYRTPTKNEFIDFKILFFCYNFICYRNTWLSIADDSIWVLFGARMKYVQFVRNVHFDVNVIRLVSHAIHKINLGVFAQSINK